MFLTSHVSAKTSVSFVVIRRSFSALYLNSNVPSSPILPFQEMALPETPHLSPHTHYLHAVCTGYVRTVMKVILPANMWLYLNWQWRDLLKIGVLVKTSIQNIAKYRILRLVCDYIHVPLIVNYMFSLPVHYV